MEVPPITVEAEPVPGSTSAPELYRLETVVPQVRDTRDAFERQPNDRASDVIGRMPGVVISGPPGEKKAVNLRGLGPDFNRIEVNGVQLPSSSQSRSFELMNLPAFLVQDIAIIRNPSAEYEGDGIAGRIAVTTRSIPHAPTLEVRGAFGSVNDQWQEHRQASLGYGQRLYNRFGFMGAVNYDRRLILKVKDFSELTFSGGPGGQGFLRDEFEQKFSRTSTSSLTSATSMAAARSISSRCIYTDLDKQRDQFRRATGQFQDRTLTNADEETETVGLTVEQTHRFGAGFELKAHAGYFHTGFDSTSNDTTLNSALAFANGSSEDSVIRDELVQAGASLAMPFHVGLPQEVKVGLAFRRGDRSSDRDVFTVDGVGRRSQRSADVAVSVESDYAITETYYAAFIQDRLTVTERLSLTPGLRLEHVVDDLRGGVGVDKRPDFTDVLPSLPMLYRATDRLAFHAAVARQVNRPKFDEIAPGITPRGPRTFVGNPDLEPARAWSFDLGSSYVTPHFFLGINLYYRSLPTSSKPRKSPPTPSSFATSAMAMPGVSNSSSAFALPPSALNGWTGSRSWPTRPS